MASKAELEREIKTLRQQMARLEKRCQQREDKLMWVLEVIEPFFGVLTEAQKKKLEAELEI